MFLHNLRPLLPLLDLMALVIVLALAFGFLVMVVGLVVFLVAQ